MKISLVVAMAENRVIGADGGLPWHLPEDLRHFKRLTTGGVMVMGRKTFESIGRPLPKRQTVILTRQEDYPLPEKGRRRVALAADLERALAVAREAGVSEVFVVGGGEVFRQALERAERVYLTRVHAEIEGEVTFPELGGGWELVSKRHHPADERHVYPFTFELWERRSSAAAASADGLTSAAIATPRK